MISIEDKVYIIENFEIVETPIAAIFKKGDQTLVVLSQRPDILFFADRFSLQANCLYHQYDIKRNKLYHKKQIAYLDIEEAKTELREELLKKLELSYRVTTDKE